MKTKNVQGKAKLIKEEIRFLKSLIKSGWDNWKNRNEALNVGMEKEYDVKQSCKQRIKELNNLL